MPWSLLILPLLGGYCFLHYFYPTKYRAQALSQYRLLFEAGLVGLCSVLVSRILVALIHWSGLASGAIVWWKTQFFPIPYSGTCSLAFVLCLLAAIGFNIPLHRGPASERAYIGYAGELMRLVVRAQSGTDRGPLPLLITLKNRKAYIGVVHAAPTPDQPKQYLSLLPTVSGYRDKDTLKLVLTTHYGQVYERLDSKKLSSGESWDLEDFAVVIPLDEIVSATTFVETVQVSEFDPPPRDRTREATRTRSRAQPRPERPA